MLLFSSNRIGDFDSNYLQLYLDRKGIIEWVIEKKAPLGENRRKLAKICQKRDNSVDPCF
jgi:hypothetical protein